MGDPIQEKHVLRKALEDLLRRQQQVTKDKESNAAAYNDDLKQIKAEIKATLADIDALNSV